MTFRNTKILLSEPKVPFSRRRAQWSVQRARHNSTIAIWSYYYDWTAKYINYIRQHRHTSQAQHTPPDVTTVECSYI